MPTAEPARSQVRPDRRQGEPAISSAAAGEQATAERRWAWPVLGAVLLAALGLRLWGIGEGLPYVYNIDEAGHFVPKAVQMFEPGHGLNPGYFVNPPALTYVLHVVLAVWFGGGHGVLREYDLHPDNVFLLSRVVAAVLGSGAVWLLYLFAARLFDRRIALLAAAIEAVAFLPVFYGHLALNDAVTLLPLTLSLLGSAGILRYGRRHDYAIAGLGLGFACASKYTAGIAILPLAAAAASRYLEEPAAAGRDTPALAGRRTLTGLAIAGGCALAAFLLANPYALLDFARFRSELVHQSSLSEEAQGKLGAPKQGGVLYYLWALTWGLGWIPALAALGGAIAVWWRAAGGGQRVGWLLVGAPILFLAFMGLQDRYFGRWLLPIFPILCVLAAFFAIFMVRAASSHTRVPAVIPGVALTVLLLAQGTIFSTHGDLVLARADTRNLTRAWMIAHIPPGSRIVLEPVVLGEWLASSPGSSTRLWQKYPTLESVIAPDGTLAPQDIHKVALEDYETTLSPALIGSYEQQGYCWVITGSTESGRALVDPRAAPVAAAYYRALAATAQVVYHVSPYSAGSSSPAFNFDWSFDYYPLSYRAPGPEMTVYRLTGRRCRQGA
ncbi:MAG TPA: glycosyltransferase family 39 protein [Solirubrobacteraceae bacterium]|jgi:4-amino-4-deoxy-L-arabinose transferase-like glycosyltransferase|nr:glycosyltransferase family 39 protein [Solirubrobacteraceae bacterium]